MTLTLANLVICLIGGYTCICRAIMMSKDDTKLAIRVQYVIWFGLFSASSISWTYGEPASVVQVIMSGAIVAHLLLGLEAWKNGAPAYTMRGPA